MNYKELKKMAKPYIKTNHIPTNAFTILTDIGIPFKNEKHCKEDFGSNISPIFNTPAFLAVYKGVKTIYFNSNAMYLNFYILHEISHYLLNHEFDSPQNEADANMLACILAAPVENLPTTFKTATDLSVNANIPIDKAEEYWDIIKDKINRKYFSKKQKTIAVFAVILIVLSILCVILFTTYSSGNLNNSKTKNITQPDTFQTTAPSSSEQPSSDAVIVTSFGEKYHLKDCKHIKYKTNLTEYNINDAINYGFNPCEDCIE